jgi:hypothetical protein
MEEAYTNGLTVGYMKVTGLIIKCKGKVCINGQMVGHTKVSTSMIRNTDLEFINGLMVVFMKAIGLKGNNTARGSIQVNKMKSSMEFGRMERGLSGLRKLNNSKGKRSDIETCI